MLESLIFSKISAISNLVVLTGVNLFVQSTIILATGLTIDWLVRSKGAAVQSIVLRIFLVAVLVSPVVSIGLRYYGFDGISLNIPVISAEYPAVQNLTALSENNKLQNHEITGDKTLLSNIHGGEKVTTVNPTPENSNKLNSIKNIPEIPNLKKPVSTPAHEYSQNDTQTEIRISDNESGRKYNPDINAGRKSRINFISWLYIAGTILWIVSTFILAVKLLGASLYVLYMRYTIYEAKPYYRSMCETIAAELGIKAPDILQSPYIKTPLLAGVFRPVIVMPIKPDESSDPCREILLHELSHFKRHDTFWNYLRQLGITILPFQPLMWILSHRIEETSDYVCDDFVLHHTANQKNYAAGLARMALRYFPEHTRLSVGAGFISVKSSLKRRIMRVLDTTRKISLKVSARLVFNVSFLCAFTTFLSGLIGIKGNNIIHESYASETKSDEDKQKTAYKTYDTLIPERDTFAAANDNENQSLTQNSGNIPEQRHNNEIVTITTDTKNIDLKEADPQLNSESEKAHLIASVEHPQVTDTETGFEIPQVISQPTTETVKTTENTSLVAVIGDDIDQESDQRAETIPAKTGKDTVITDNSETADFSTFVSNIDFEMTDSAASSSSAIHDTDISAVDVVIAFDYENADRSEPNQRKLCDIYQSLSKNKRYPVWSPNGKQIAFNDSEYGIWLVDAEGGVPEILYENYYSLKYNDSQLHYGGLQTIGFSPDGKEIAFLRYDIDTEWGTTVKLDNSSQTYSIEYPIPVIESVTISTGETRTLARGGITGCWSHSGRYFAYITQDLSLRRKLWIRDLDSGEIREIECKQPSKVCFSADDTAVYVSEQVENNLRRISRVSLFDGESEVVPLPENSSLADVSLDGRWILFVDWSANLQQLLFDTQTEEILNIFPIRQYATTWSMFSPDGSKICLNYLENRNGELMWNMYIHNLDLPTTNFTDVDTDIPEPFTIKGNHPNPFNIATTIDFSIPESGYVSLVIYNIRGQKVRELISLRMEAGSHHVIWDGNNDYGVRVSSGPYFLKLAAGSETIKHKIMMLK